MSIKQKNTILDRNENSWNNTKKIGTLIGDTEDVQRRKQLSTAALAKLQNVWVRGNKLKKKINWSCIEHLSNLS